MLRGPPGSTLTETPGSPAEALHPIAAPPTAVPRGSNIEPTIDRTPDPGSAGSRPRLALWLATAGPAGHAPIAPGTFGSAVGVLLYVPLARSPALFAVVTTLVLGLGVWSADVAERAFGKRDDGRIVIDEVAGQLLTLAPLVYLAPAAVARSPWILLLGFLLFRALDIWKPGPVAWGERRFHGGLGVMLDDVIAGLLGAVLLGALAGAGVFGGLA